MLRAIGIVAAGSWQPPPADVISLDYDHRTRRRIALKCRDGLEFLLDLPRAQVLRAGDGLRLDDGRVIAVAAAPEPLLEISCGTPSALSRVAWHLGNRHLPAEIGQHAILIRADHVIADMVRGLGAQVRAVNRPFNPERGAYADRAEHHHHHHQPHHHHGDGDDHGSEPS